MTDEQYRLCEREEGVIPWVIDEFLTEMAREFLSNRTEKWHSLWGVVMEGETVPRIRPQKRNPVQCTFFKCNPHILRGLLPDERRDDE